VTEPCAAVVLGLGLMGGSLARDLAARGYRVLGWDRDASAVESAHRAGVVHAGLSDDFGGIGDADLVVLAVPVSAAPPLLEAVRPHLHRARLITDLGSTKRSIVAAAEVLGVGERFVGSHPLTGSHQSGWEAARAGMFGGARVFLCPTRSSSAAAMAMARELWTSLSARTEVVDAAEHDRLLAWTSHLPQAVSTALALALASNDVARGELGPGGRDVTRLAGSSPEVWTGIALDNAQVLIEAVSAMETGLCGFREALEAKDADAVRRFFARAREWAER
jgi:prephenate dehydrogenase